MDVLDDELEEIVDEELIVPERLAGESALEYVERIQAINQQRETEGLPPLRARPYEPEDWQDVRMPFKETD